jgi:polar amino acid transport system substrate-binding protein
MRAKWTHLLAVLAAVALASPYGQAQPANPIAAPLSDKELIVATKEAPPFAMKRQDGTWRGISIDLWRRIAERLDLRYRISEQPTVQALVD